MIKYYTVLNDGEGELTIEKSKFIGYAREVNSRESADKFFNEIRMKHRDASHNVPAFVVGNNMELKWASDDGEPQGTSGPPILKFLENEKLTNVAVIVSRYFGGIKLGKGGLARAYTLVAKEAIISAGYAMVVEAVSLRCEIAYAYYDKLTNALTANGYSISNVDFLEKVTLTVLVEREYEERLLEIMSSITGGTHEIVERVEQDIKIEHKEIKT